MKYIKDINFMLMRCAELHTYKGTMNASTPEYIQFEKELSDFAKKYDLKDLSEWHNIKYNLLRIPGQTMSHQNVFDITTNLLVLRGKPQYGKISFDRVFISHSSEDSHYVRSFVDLLETIGLDKRTIFCSSVEGYGIPLCQDIYEYLKREFTDKNILVIIFLSENYYQSKPCMSEMGATWVMSKDYLTILLGEFDFNQIEGPINSHKIGFKITDTKRLDECKGMLIEALGLPEMDEHKWIKARDKFLNEVINKP